MKAMKKEKLIDGLDALASGDFASWRKRLPVDERMTDYELILRAIETLKKSKTVAHGYWKCERIQPENGYNYNVAYDRYSCSNCAYRLKHNEIHSFNFCPKCGARMDKEDE